MAQTEACMALPGPAKGLAVATVTYINYPSRRKPSFRRAPGCGLRFCPPRGFSDVREAFSVGKGLNIFPKRVFTVRVTESHPLSVSIALWQCGLAVGGAHH